MAPLVSVIIPVYNVEKYLGRCVNSVRNQTLKNIEIILVDDGSPDQCPILCDQFAVQDERIYVIHKKNGGLSSARNAGMRVAKGKYLFFVDSDDWIEIYTLEELVATAEKYSVDWVRFRPMYAGWPEYKDGTLCDFGTEKGMKEGIYQKKDIISKIYPRLFATSTLTLGPIVAAWRSLYRTEFIQKKNLYFDEEVRYSEDTIFSAKVVVATNKFYYLDGPRYYHYFYNSDSITKAFRPDRWDSCKKLMKCFEDNFSNRDDYDFSVQLRLQKIYCILNAFAQKDTIVDKKQKEAYCRMICNDPVCIEALKYINLVAPIKIKIVLWIIKTRIVSIISRI